MAHEWTDDEMAIVLKLYCELPRGKTNQSNPEVIRIAKLIGRTPASVNMRLGNYAAVDSDYTKDGKKGLDHVGKNVKETWNKFSNSMEKLTEMVDAAMKRAYGYEADEMNLAMTHSFEVFPAGGEVEQTIMARKNQSFFRTVVLSSYNNRCCITGIDERSLLNASHIKPWRDSAPDTERTNPQNGLCLNVLHDRAFDRGLLTIGAKDHKIIISKSLKRNVDSDAYEKFFGIYEDRRITMPTKFPPGEVFLRYHNESVFEH